MPAVSRHGGILALQGALEPHARMLAQLCLEPVLVRTPSDLTGLSVLCLPGGESTTMSLLLDETGLRAPLRNAVVSGLPTLATCAGAILLARELKGDTGSIQVEPLGLLDAVVNRNAYGRQVNSFTAELSVDWTALDAPDSGAFPGVFIRAPRIEEPGPGVKPVAFLDGAAVAVRQGNILATEFHPELANDPRLHAAVLAWSW